MPSLNAIPPDAIRVVPDDLRTLASDILCRPDLLHADARRISDCLVAVDLRGVVSHGTCQFRRYVKKTSPADQSLPPDPPHPGNACERGIRRRRRSRLLVATQATEAVIQKACSQGIAMAATHNHGHVGSCGIYARMALKHNLVTWAVASNVLCSPSRTGAPSGSRHEHHHAQRPG